MTWSLCNVTALRLKGPTSLLSFLLDVEGKVDERTLVSRHTGTSPSALPKVLDRSHLQWWSAKVAKSQAYET
jgi:hypothetical protein